MSLKTIVAKIEAATVTQQLFRVARITLVGVAAAYASHSALDSVAVVAIAEAAFRSVFPT